MSFWEIEDVVDLSIKCLKKSNNPNLDRCSLIFTLCKFGNKWTSVGNWHGHAEEYNCDTAALIKLDMLYVMKTIAHEAEKQRDIGLLQYWYAVIQWVYANGDEGVIHSLKLNPDIIELRGLLSKDFINSSGEMEGILPTLEELNTNLATFERAHYFGPAMTEFLRWWYEPLEGYLKRAHS